jgi:hypothetical protein
MSLNVAYPPVGSTPWGGGWGEEGQYSLTSALIQTNKMVKLSLKECFNGYFIGYFNVRLENKARPERSVSY